MSESLPNSPLMPQLAAAPLRRKVFFVSDSTAITAETVGGSLLIHFQHVRFDPISLPFVNTTAKALEAVGMINRAALESGSRPLIFSTLVDPVIRGLVMGSRGMFIDFFDSYENELESELSLKSSHAVGRYHCLKNSNYDLRIGAVNYAVRNDGAFSAERFGRADVILAGLPRTGKTPTCLYLALHYGIFASRYALDGEGLRDLPLLTPELLPFRHKLYGLTIAPERLHIFRDHGSDQRRTETRTSLSQCRFETAAAEALFVLEDIPYLDVTTMSVEELAANIVQWVTRR
jgi:regulator of PEP synthase PpsR (kinase-PPPase family)